MSKHATLSPSSAHRWMACAAAPLMERDIEDTASEFAAEGTVAHAVAEAVLAGKRPDAASCVGLDIEADGFVITVTDEMAETLQVGYIDQVLSIAEDGDLLVEQELDIGWITGEDGAIGTADAIVLRDNQLVVVDLKYGRGERVCAPGNAQGRMYMAAALEAFDLLGAIETVTFVIIQPRLGHASEETLTAAEIRDWVQSVATPAAKAATDILNGAEPKFAPDAKTCRWCRAKSTCTALAAHVAATVADDFIDLTKMDEAVETIKSALPRTLDSATRAELLHVLPLIEDWCKAIANASREDLMAGLPVPGWKLVEGRRGSRRWRDAAEAEAAMKAMRIKREDMYDMTVKSPTQAEKHLKKGGVVGDRQWAKLAALIEQPQGKPTVVPETDPRQAIPPDFETIKEQ